MVLLRLIAFLLSVFAAIEGDVRFAVLLFALWFIAEVYGQHQKRQRQGVEY